jgi:hypothetical protein
MPLSHVAYWMLVAEYRLYVPCFTLGLYSCQLTALPPPHTHIFFLVLLQEKTKPICSSQLWRF